MTSLKKNYTSLILRGTFFHINIFEIRICLKTDSHDKSWFNWKHSFLEVQKSSASLNQRCLRFDETQYMYSSMSVSLYMKHNYM